MLEISQAFKDNRTRYIVDEKTQSKCILFNPSTDELDAALKTGREVTPEEWDRFVTKSMRKEQPHE